MTAHTLAASGLVALIALTALACGGPAPSDTSEDALADTPPDASTHAPEIPVAELEALHDSVRLDGLDDRRFDHATYWGVVSPLLGGAVGGELAGASAEGRDIHHLTFGSGPVTVLAWSQMHGDESTASMALADLIRFFAERPEHPIAARIAEGATVHLVPMLNPDGAERFRRRNAQGVDVNRDARRLQTPEGRLLKELNDRLEPDFGFNLHDQSPATRVGDSDRGAAIALLAPAFNEARDVDDKRRRAMQVASLLADAMEPLVGDHIARYDDTFNPRAFGDLVGAWGASTVLIESGGWADDPQKQHLRRTNFVGLLAALDAIATGDYEAWGTDTYKSLPENGRRLADLLVVGGTVVVPGLPPLEADLLINYGRPLLREDGVISDLGDLEGVSAQDTLDASGLYLVPLPAALGDDGSLDTGRPAHFLITTDAEGKNVQMRFEGGPGAEG
jgi:hypothetical protein